MPSSFDNADLLAGAAGLAGVQARRSSHPDARVAQVVALIRRPTEPHQEPRNVGVDSADLPAETCWWNVHGVIGTLGFQANGL